MTVFALFELQDKRVSGEVGIEIEVEGRNLPPEIAGWRKEADGSLRGESAEYVLRKPAKRADVKEMLGRVDIAYKDYQTVVSDSQRAGVHVHINVQDLTMTQVFNFISLYLVFENMLVKFCGKTREGNLFCLRAQDAEGLVYCLAEALRNRSFRTLGADHLRYASVNVKALANYGSLEFRAMRGTRNMALIEKWAELLLALKDEAMAYKSPVEIIQDFSLSTPEGMFEKIFRGDQELLSYKGYQADMWDNVRLVQDIAYACNWEDLATWEAKIDNPVNPFRKPVGNAVEGIHPVWQANNIQVNEGHVVNVQWNDVNLGFQAHAPQPAPKKRKPHIDPARVAEIQRKLAEAFNPEEEDI